MVQISNYKIIFTEKHFLNKFKISFELCIPQRVIKGEHNNNLYEIKRRKLCNAQAVSHNRNKLRIKSHSNFHVIMATSHTQWVHLRLNSVPCLLEGAIQDFHILGATLHINQGVSNWHARTPDLRRASSFLQVRHGNFQNCRFRPYPKCSTSCHFKFKQLKVLCNSKLQL